MLKRSHVWLSMVLVFARCAEIPTMIYGTAWKKDQTKDLVKLAISQGFRAFDTANQPKHYNETLVGAALRESLAESASGLRREDFWIQTKFTPSACEGQPKELHPYDEHADVATQVQQSMASSLEHLGVAYVDSYLLHSPFSNMEDSLTAWREMEKLQKEGKAKQIGVSNFNLAQLQLLNRTATVPPAFVQNRCLRKSMWDQAVRDFCNVANIRYQGFWMLTGNRFLASDRGVIKISEQRKQTPQQVLFQFVIQHLRIIPLSGTKSSGHMQQDLEIARGGFNLTSEQVHYIASIDTPKFTTQDPVELIFENAVTEHLRVYWQNPDSRDLVPQGELAPGKQLKLNAFHSHTFLAKADERLFLYWSADRERGAKQVVRIDQSLEAEFHNVGESTVRVFWRDKDSGKEVSQGDALPGGKLAIKTYLGHRFVVRALEGDLISEWLAEYKTAGTQIVHVQQLPQEL